MASGMSLPTVSTASGVSLPMVTIPIGMSLPTSTLPTGIATSSVLGGVTLSAASVPGSMSLPTMGMSGVGPCISSSGAFVGESDQSTVTSISKTGTTAASSSQSDTQAAVPSCATSSASATVGAPSAGLAQQYVVPPISLGVSSLSACGGVAVPSVAVGSSANCPVQFAGVGFPVGTPPVSCSRDNQPMTCVSDGQSVAAMTSSCDTVYSSLMSGAIVSPGFAAFMGSMNLPVPALWSDTDPENPYKLLQNFQHSEPQPIPFDKQHNWWRLQDTEVLRDLLKNLHLRGIRERCLQRNIEQFMDLCIFCLKRNNSDVVKLVGSSSALPQAPEDPTQWHPDIGREVELAVLDEVENMEDRICHASLQVKGFKMPAKVREEDFEKMVSRDCELSEGQKYILDVAKQKLLALEKNIERRYLKPPFCKSVRLSLASLTSTPPKDRDRGSRMEESSEGPDHSAYDDGAAVGGDSEQTEATDLEAGVEMEDEDDEEEELRAHLPKELLRWRDCVHQAESASQIMVYLLQLNDCISWEKSIMKVSCQICCQDDNEAELLLCDSCDKGYHTYCFKPKMDDIPDGDWYCFECISRATGEACCVVCGKAGTKLAECEFCPRSIHTDCMDPPLTRVPKKWACAACSLDKSKVKKKRSRLSSSSSALTLSTLKDIKNAVLMKDSSKHDSRSSSALSLASQTQVSASPTKEADSKKKEKSKKSKKSEKSEKESKATSSKKPKEKAKKSKKKKKEKAPPDKDTKDKKDSDKKKKKRKTDSEETADSSQPTDKKRTKKEQKKSEKAEKVRKDSKHTDKIDTKVQAKSETELSTNDAPKTATPTEIACTTTAIAEQKLPCADNSDMSPCLIMLEELQKHQDSWPFLVAVDGRRFPSYRKVIKKPMDLMTMGNKLKQNQYASRQEFAADVLLICDNCVTFNEDDSAVGRAGHSLRAFFLKRWPLLCPVVMGNNPSS